MTHAELQLTLLQAGVTQWRPLEQLNHSIAPDADRHRCPTHTLTNQRATRTLCRHNETTIVSHKPPQAYALFVDGGTARELKGAGLAVVHTNVVKLRRDSTISKQLHPAKFKAMSCVVSSDNRCIACTTLTFCFSLSTWQVSHDKLMWPNPHYTARWQFRRLPWHSVLLSLAI